MGHRLTILIIFIAMLIAGKAQGKEATPEYFAEFKSKIALDSSQYALVFFHNEGSCGSCLNMFLSELIELKKKNLSNLKIVIYAHGDREIEIKQFRKAYDSLGYVLLNNKMYQRSLGLEDLCAFALINYNGQILFDLDWDKAKKTTLASQLNLYLPEPMEGK